MHCRTCGYALWNLPTNVCPECGTTFDLRTYQFQPGTVEFACPVCDHRYLGHGPNYVPSDADEVECLQCHQKVATAQFRVIPLTPDAVAIDPQRVAWEHRHIVGFWKAWWATWKLAVLKPAELGSQLGAGRSGWDAVGFAALTHGMSSVIGMVVVLVLVAGMMFSSGGGGGMNWAHISLFSGWVFTMAWMLFCVLTAHVVVKLTGRHRGDWVLTVRALSYAQAPFLLASIPVLCTCTPLLTWIWYVISGTIILSQVQKISLWRALLATAWTFIVGAMLLAWLVLAMLQQVR